MSAGQGIDRDSPLAGLSLPQGPDWLQRLREQARLALVSSGLPDNGWEHWRHNSLALFNEHQLLSATRSGDPGQDLAVLDELLGRDAHSPRLIFVDGLLDLRLSALDRLPHGVNISSLSGGPVALDEANPPNGLACSTDLQASPIMAMNTALLRDALFVRVEPASKPDVPLLVASYCSSQGAGRLSYPRLLVDVAEGAEFQLIEWHGGAQGVDYASAPVTEVFVAEGANFGLARISEDGDKGHQAGAVSMDVAANARIAAHSYVYGGEQVRVEMSATLNGEAGEAELSGFHLSDERQFVEHHSCVQHQCEGARSRQFFKGVLGGRSESLFDGMVCVSPGAQRTDAEQQNRNLLLSPRALAHSVPRLEIYADDVRCSHGSSVGQLDEQALFYMRARGLAREWAQALLTRVFAVEAIDFSPIAAAQAYELERLDGFLYLAPDLPVGGELEQIGNRG